MTSFDKIINRPTQFALLLLFLLFLIITFIPALLVYSTMFAYNDSTLAGMHISAASNLLIFFVTLAYVFLTLNLVTQSKEAVTQSKEAITQSKEAITQSKEAITQSKKEQQIRDIENKLEKFYIPADDIINLKHRHKERTINGFVRNDNQFVQGLKHLRKYSYLADNETYEAYEKCISAECTNPKSTTCRDTYKNGEFTKCEYHEYTCETNFEKCPHNLIYCKYNPDDPKTNNGEYESEKNKCTLNNANCNYINDLKDAITEDIERYKGRLSDLKE